ncbi:hypothetical protein BRETT_001343 [Brettanomyces bruxellensis]|uniref:DNA replication checkpoint mediator MRC1 domain-containing protein n=1 Tax=Dekkera bruxellensis TaxID=5007 RepID=A0A871RCY0_DEKBR|nr:uncharacterized protein BRETT_001343 [Brettanomyces bruxellensis]QOU21618.1 hypothetical protein BRETT_001343 [Brettanomyces bruxellensis]
MSEISVHEDDDPDSESQVDFASFTIFKNNNSKDELLSDTQKTNEDSLKLTQKPNLSVLGLDSSLITNIMKRMKGSHESTQQVGEKKEKASDKLEKNDDDDQPLYTQRINESAKPGATQLKPTLSLGSTERIEESSRGLETEPIEETVTIPQTATIPQIDETITQTLALETEPGSTQKATQTNISMHSTLRLDSNQEASSSSTTQVIPKTQATTQKIASGLSLKNQLTAQVIPKTQFLSQSVKATVPIESNETIGEEVENEDGNGVQDEDVDEDEEIVTTHRRKGALTQLGDDSKSANVKDKTFEALGVPLEKYKRMTREEKINLRLAEKKKDREAKEKKKHKMSQEVSETKKDNKHAKAIDIKSVELTSKKSRRKTNPEMKKLANAVKQNALIRSSGLIIRKSDKTKFTPGKLLAAFESSSDEEEKDEKVFSEANKETPESSPKLVDQNVTVRPEKTDKVYFVGKAGGKKSDIHIPLGSYREHILEESGQEKMVDLDSDDDNDDDIDQEPSATDKKRLFDLKRMLSQKLTRKRERKKTIKDLLRQETLKQMIKLNKERQKRTTSGQKEDAANQKEIMEMMQQELERNKRLAKVEQEKERRNKMILQGKLPVEEELDESEIEDEEEDEDEDENKEKQEESEDGAENQKNTESDDESNSNHAASEISFQIPDASAIKANKASSMLADLFDQSTTSNKSFEGVQGVDVLRKLQDVDSNVSAHNSTLMSKDSEQFKDDSTTSEWMDNSVVNNVSFADIRDSKQDISKIDTGLESQVVQEKKKILDSQNFLPETQVDEADMATQPVAVDDDDDDEKVHVSGRKRVLKAAQQDIKGDENKDVNENENYGDDDDDDEIVYEDDETRKKRVELINAARRRAIERENKQRRAFKEAGMGEMMENEAVESDDEWQGIGGADGEDPEVENSEDEKILDDASKIVVDKDKIRADLAKHDIKADDEMVKKIYTDLKTGAFRRRRARDGAYELELSDDEDEYMRQFYEHRRQEYLEKQYMKDANLRKLAKSQSSRAFYDTIASDSIRSASIKFEDSVDEVESPVDNPFEDNGKDKNESVSGGEKDGNGKKDGLFTKEGGNSREDSSGDHGEDDDDDILIRPKKRRKLTVNQVRSMISFLDEDEDQGEGILDGLSGDEKDMLDDDGAAEIKYIKKHMRVKIPRKLVGRAEKNQKAATGESSKSNVISLEDGGESIQPISDDELEDAGVGLLAARTHSLASSFRKGKKKKARYSTTTGHEVHEVHVIVGSKPVAHSTGSVSSLTARRSFAMEKIQLKNGKAAKIAKSLKSVRHTETMMKIYKSMSSFDDGWQ